MEIETNDDDDGDDDIINYIQFILMLIHQHIAVVPSTVVTQKLININTRTNERKYKNSIRNTHARYARIALFTTSQCKFDYKVGLNFQLHSI